MLHSPVLSSAVGVPIARFALRRKYNKRFILAQSVMDPVKSRHIRSSCDRACLNDLTLEGEGHCCLLGVAVISFLVLKGIYAYR